MASSLQRLASNSCKAYRSALAPFSTDGALSEFKAGELGIVSGIPHDQLRRKAMIFSPARTASQQGSGTVGRWKINFLSTHNHLLQISKISSKSLLTQTLFHRSLTTEARTQKLEQIADELISLTRIERHDYVILLRHKMGLNRFGPAASAPTPSAAGGTSAAPAAAAAKEKTAFDIKLEKFEASAKLKVIKEIRAFTDLGLKEAKDLVEKVPAVVKKGVTKEEAEKILEKLKGVGATAVLE